MGWIDVLLTGGGCVVGLEDCCCSFTCSSSCLYFVIVGVKKYSSTSMAPCKEVGVSSLVSNKTFSRYNNESLKVLYYVNINLSYYKNILLRKKAYPNGVTMCLNS